MRLRKLVALTLAAFLTVGSIPMESVRAAAPDLTDEANLEMSAAADVSIDESDTDLSEPEAANEDAQEAVEETTEEAAEEITEETAEEITEEALDAGQETADGDIDAPSEEEEEPALVGGSSGMTLNANGGEFLIWDSQKYKYIISATYTLDYTTDYLADYQPSREGYWFAGWYDAADTEKANYLSRYGSTVEEGGYEYTYLDEYYRDYLLVYPEEGTTVYAGWEAPAVLDFNGGSWYDQYEDEEVTSYVMSFRTTYLGDIVPTRDGWYFTGWYADKDCKQLLSDSDNIYSLNKSPESACRIYAGWTQDVYTVSFDFGDKATYKGRYSDYNSVSVVELEVPYGQKVGNKFYDHELEYTDLHYSLKGWVDKDKNPIDLYYYVPTGDVTLYAEYIKSRMIVTLDANGGYMDRKYDHVSQKFVKKLVREKSCDANDGTKISLEDDELPKNDDPRMAFAGWYTDKACKNPVAKYNDDDCEEAWDEQRDYYYIRVGTDDVTLYAKWENSNYVLTLDPNADDGYFKDYDTEYERTEYKQLGGAPGVTVERSVYEPQREDKHYKFTGWYSDKACKNRVGATGDNLAHITYTLTKDTTWYAGWKKTNSVVTVDAGEGYFSYSAGFESEDNVKTATFVPYPGGYLQGMLYGPYIDDPHKVFEGWYIGNKRIGDSIFDYTYSGDTTVTAHYAECYAVTYDYNGGYYEEWDSEAQEEVKQTKPLTIKVPKGKAVYEANASVHDPYYEDDAKTFGGWYLASDTQHANKINPYDFTPTGDATLVAFWANNYTVTFDAGTGSFAGGQKNKKYKAVENTFFKYNDGATIPDDPDVNDDSQVFGGWYLNGKKVSREDILNSRITEDVTYTAQYTAAYTVTFDPGEGSFVSKTPNVEGGKYKIKVAMGEPVRGKAPTVKSDDPEHKVFYGWFEDIPGALNFIREDLYSKVFDKNVTLKARWEGCYTLTFHTNREGATFANGSDTQVVKVIRGTAFRYGEESGEETKSRDVLYETPRVTDAAGGYVLPGWYDKSDFSGNKYSFSTYNSYVETSKGERTYFNNMYGFIPTGDMDFYAKITDDAVTVKFNINDKTAKFEDCENYSYDKPYLSELNDGATIWTVTVPKGILFGEIGEPNDFVYETREGRDYRWAYSDTACKKRVDNDLAITKDTTVYCYWYKYGSGGGSADGKAAEITFHAGEGYFSEYDKADKTEKYSYNYGTYTWQGCPEPKIDDDTRAFKGWYYDAELTKPYPAEYQLVRYSGGYYYHQVSFPEKVDDLYAAYGKAYTVLFDANGGYFDEDYDRTKDPDQGMRETTMVRAKVYPGQSVIISDYTKRVRRDGTRILDGWYLDKACKNKATVYALDSDSELFKPSDDITLYAGWVDYEKPESVVASADKLQIKIGESIDLKAAVTPELGEGDVHWFIEWFSAGESNTEYEQPVKLDISGRATGRAEGDCSVYAMVNGVRSESLLIEVGSDIVDCEFKLTDGEGNSFDGAQNLYTGEGLAVKGVITPDDVAEDLAAAISWKSSDSSVADITVTGDGRDAIVHAGNEGKATITASLGDITQTVEIEVICPIKFADDNLMLTASSGAQRTVNTAVLHGSIWKGVKAYTSADGATESDLVTVTTSVGIAGAGGRKDSLPVVIEPTAKGLAITESHTITIIAAVEVSGRGTFTDKCTLTLNPQPQVGRITANIGTGYAADDAAAIAVVDKGTKILLHCNTAGTEIYYTVNGGIPSKDAYDAAVAAGTEAECATQLFNDAIVINGNTNIKAYAVRTAGNMKDSKLYYFAYAVLDWGDAEAYKVSVFSNDISNVPTGIWYLVDGKCYSELNGGAVATELKKTYTGSKITFNSEIKVFEGTKRLIENRDYTLSYANNTNAASKDAVKGTKSIAPTVNVKGKGNYTKTAALKFTILPVSIYMTQPVSGGIEFAAAGTKLSAVKPVLKFNGKKLTLGKDFEIKFFKYFNNDNGSYSGEVEDPSKVVLEKGDIYYIRVAGKEGSNFDPGTSGALQARAIDKAKTVTADKLKIVDAKGKPLKVDYTGGSIHLGAAPEYPGDVDPKGIYDLLKPDENGVAQAYISDGRNILPYEEDSAKAYYSIQENGRSYDNYTDTGVHKVTIYCNDKELGGKTYSGMATLSYEITGKSLKSVKIAGLSTTAEYNLFTPVALTDLFNAKDKTIIAQNKAEEDPAKKWKAVTLYTTTTQKVGNKKVTVYHALTEGTDYEVAWENNTGLIGKCNLIFTGKGLYKDSIKKTITVKAYDLNDVKKGDARKIFVTAYETAYSKTGAKPRVEVTYGGTALREGIDYTISYKNASKLCEDYNAVAAAKRPTVVVKGKGNYKGSNTTAYFNIRKANIAYDVTMQLNDVVNDSKNKSMFRLFSVPKFLDNGKALSSGKNTDIDQISGVCTYAEDTVLLDGKKKYAGDFLNAYDQVPGGTLIKEEITVTIYPAEKGSKVRTKDSMYYASGDNYSATITGYYRIVDEGMDISKMTAEIKKGVTYSFNGGEEVVPLKTTDIQVYYKVKGQKDPVYLDPSDFEIVSVTNNKLLGKASVTIRGKGQYGGTKTFTFKITARNMGK